MSTSTQHVLIIFERWALSQAYAHSWKCRIRYDIRRCAGYVTYSNCIKYRFTSLDAANFFDGEAPVLPTDTCFKLQSSPLLLYRSKSMRISTKSKREFSSPKQLAIFSPLALWLRFGIATRTCECQVRANDSFEMSVLAIKTMRRTHRTGRAANTSTSQTGITRSKVCVNAIARCQF